MRGSTAVKRLASYKPLQRKCLAAVAAPHLVLTSFNRISRRQEVVVRAADGDIKRAPWSITFDLRERDTLWTEENKARLIRIVASNQLDISLDELEARLRDLVLLVPDLEGKLHRMTPKLLADILESPELLMHHLMGLREAFPHANLSSMVAQQPQLLLRAPADITAAVEQLKQLLGVQQVDKLVEAQPQYLDLEHVQEVLVEMQRLMPKADIVGMLVRDPSWLTRVERGQKRLGQHPD